MPNDSRIPIDTIERLYSASELRRWSLGQRSAVAYRRLQESLVRLVRSGGHLVTGTDSPAVPYGYGLHLELQLLADSGIPNDHVLRIATAEGALALGLDGQLGTLEAGKLADFVVLTGNPLQRIADTQSITAVVKAGVWMDQSELLNRR